MPRINEHLDVDTMEQVALHFRSMVASLAPRCACSDELDVALDGIAKDARHNDLKNRLAGARSARNTIKGLIELLSDLDDIDADEPDQTVFEEFRQLFEDAEAAAADAARLLAKPQACDATTQRSELVSATTSNRS